MALRVDFVDVVDLVDGVSRSNKKGKGGDSFGPASEAALQLVFRELDAAAG